MTKRKCESQTMNCRIFRRELENSDASTPPALNRDSRTHAAQCAACAAQWREHLSLQCLLRNLDTVTPPADFDARLFARLDRCEPTQGFTAQGFRRIGLPNFAPQTIFARAVTCCVSLAFLAFIFQSSSFVTTQNSFPQEHNDEESIASQPATPSLVTPISNSALIATTTRNDEMFSADSASDITNQPPTYTSKASVTLSSIEQRHAISKRRAQVSSRISRAAVAEAIASTEFNRSQRARAAMHSRDATIRVSPRMMEATLRDGRRAGQAVMLNAVSFGDDTLSHTAKLASVNSQQGIW